MHVTTSKDQSVSEFVSLVQQGIAKWVEAGQIVSAKLDEDPDWAEKAVEAVPGLTIETVMRFDALGRNKLKPQLLLNNCPGFRALARMDVELQSRYISHPVPVLIETEAGWSTLNVPCDTLTEQQAKQVFTKDGLRTEAQQRAWIEEKRAAKKQAPAPPEPYEIRGGKVTFNPTYTFGVHELAQILAKLSK